MAALLSGRERLDGEAEQYFAMGITFQQGMRGELVEDVQRAIGAHPDGVWGPGTQEVYEAWQKLHGLGETGVVDRADWTRVQRELRTIRDLSGEEDFAEMWEKHPHNYLDDPSQNTSSDDLVADLGMAEGSVPNTCALRLSTMMNRLGGGIALSTGKAREAGLHRMREGGLYTPRVDDQETPSKKDRVILSAREMWTYWEKHRGPPDFVWPERGRFKTAEEAATGAQEAMEQAKGRKGVVAFDKIFGYSGTGHVDLFDGVDLSDTTDWYPSQRIMLWYVVDIAEDVDTP
ncbi:MAG: hypothetical protein KTR31_17215 [Myxococcales bacterium]|nr:hypothetical protein [Myxococcales bacterium]